MIAMNLQYTPPSRQKAFRNTYPASHFLKVEIGWTFLARAYWGGVYNGEMKRLMLRHAFRFVDGVVFLVGKQNVRSQRAVEKIGGVRVGTRPDAGGHDSYVYRITATDFAAQEGRRPEEAR